MVLSNECCELPIHSGTEHAMQHVLMQDNCRHLRREKKPTEHLTGLLSYKAFSSGKQ